MMWKAFKAIVLISSISMMASNCHEILNPNLDGRTIVYVFTPFDDCGNVNVRLVPQQAEHLAKSGIKNIHIMGFYGQGPTLPLESRKVLTLAWVKETDRLGLKLIVEIGAMPFPDQLELAKFCSKINVSAISAIPVLVYEAKTAEEIVEDYQRLSEAAPNLPLMYRAIAETGPIITPGQAFAKLIRRVKTFAGAAVSIDSALDIKASLPSVAGYQIWIFGFKTIAPAHAIKINASVTYIPNLCPKAALEIENLVYGGYFDQAFDLQHQLELFVQAILSNDGDIIVYNSRSFMKYMRATYRILTGMDLGERLPFEKANSFELDTISCNLREFEDFINRYCK